MVVETDPPHVKGPADPPEQAPRAEALDEMDQIKPLTRSRTKILNILDGVRAQRGAVLVYIGLEEDFCVSSILRVDRDAGSILFDHTLDRFKGRPASLEKARLMFECGYEGARIRFQSTQVCEALSEARPAFRIPTPEFVWWFERRRQLRYAVRPFGSLKIALSLGAMLNVEADVVDVSASGVGLVTRVRNVDLEPGQVLNNCAIILPGVGRIVLDVLVKYVNPLQTDQGDGPLKRIGCQFMDLSVDRQQLVKHYVMGLRPSQQ